MFYSYRPAPASPCTDLRPAISGQSAAPRTLPLPTVRPLGRPHAEPEPVRPFPQTLAAPPAEVLFRVHRRLSVAGGRGGGGVGRTSVALPSACPPAPLRPPTGDGWGCLVGESARPFHENERPTWVISRRPIVSASTPRTRYTTLLSFTADRPIDRPTDRPTIHFILSTRPLASPLPSLHFPFHSTSGLNLHARCLRHVHTFHRRACC